MKITKPETVQTTPEAPRKAESRLELRRRPIADLTQRQMEGAAGGHPHDSWCEGACPAATGDGPSCAPTCDGAGACGATAGDTCGDTCDLGGCELASASPERCA